jgi:serine phosphatase RsbU (regulator of sigma subunit)
MLYTDGLVEGRRGRGQILGVPGLIELAALSRMLPGTPVLVDDLLDRVEQAYGGTMADDVAVVVLQWPLGGAPW